MPWLGNLNTDFTSNNCLSESIELTKNVNLDIYKNSRYNIDFDSRSKFLFTGGNMGKNVIIVGADISSLCILIIKINIS